jgi:hypothetical protein
MGMNFRQRFEAWHKAKYGYVNPPPKGFTAFNCVYQEKLQQARWEAWQACDNAYAEERAMNNKE